MRREGASGRDDIRIIAAAGAPTAAWAVSGESCERGRGSGWERYGWVMAIVWLVFLYFPVTALLRSHVDPAWIVTGWVAIAAFVVIYVGAFLNGMRGSGGGLTIRPRAIQWCAFAALIVCGALTIPSVGGGALSFIPFIMSFASYGLTRQAHWLTVAGGVGATALVVFLTPGGMAYLSVLAIVLLLAVVNTVSTSLILSSHDAERLALDLATSEGREAVARDVHDLIGHSLTVVRMKAELARRLIDTDPDRARAELADIEALTAEATASVRDTVAGIRSATLADQLASCRDVLAGAGIALRVEGGVAALSPAQSLTASWILREATTNVLRHAHAAAVVVRITPGVLSVTDDGGGLALGATDRRGGNGIRGMRERAAMAGAVLSLTAAKPHGTTVAVTW